MIEPKECGDEVAVAVHVRVGVGRSVAEEVEGVLPAEVEKNDVEDEETDNDAVGDELVGEDGLEEEGGEGEDEDLGKGDEVEFLEVLKELIVVVTRDCLAKDAAEQHYGEKDKFDDGERREFREPVGGLAQGEGVVDTVESGIAFSPDELAGVESGDYEEKESRVPFYRRDHEVGDGVELAIVAAAGEVAL